MLQMVSFAVLLALAGAAVGQLSPGSGSGQEAASANACQCTGVDYIDNGSYFIDVNTRGNFSFASQFTG